MSAAAARTLLGRMHELGIAPHDITADSRRVAPGCVFAAWPGQRTDGRRYLADAEARGAAALLWESGDVFAYAEGRTPAFAVPDLRVRPT